MCRTALSRTGTGWLTSARMKVSVSSASSVHSWPSATVFVSSFILFWIIKKTVGLRVSERHELDGLDISEHGMWGYPEQFMPVPGGAYIHPDAIAAPAHVTEARS